MTAGGRRHRLPLSPEQGARSMSDVLRDRRVAILATDGVERVELEQPRQAVEGAGAQVELLSIHDGEIAARNNDLEDAGTFTVDRLVGDASVDDYDALLLPGGTVNPDKLRMDQRAVDFVREFLESGKPVAAGLPVAPVSLTPPQNDLDMGRFLIDRNAEILEAAGATRVQRVYIDRITGNCSHQHGTARMGDDPDASVLDRNCRTHEVDNLFAVDGSPLPTGTGANPT